MQDMKWNDGLSRSGHESLGSRRIVHGRNRSSKKFMLLPLASVINRVKRQERCRAVESDKFNILFFKHDSRPQRSVDSHVHRGGHRYLFG